MVPHSCRLLITAASLLVPRALRADWKREWNAELWHKAEAGAAERELIGCARGAFRDAAWFRSSEFVKSDLAEDAFFAKPLRLEFTLLAVALVLCAWTGVFGKFRLPHENEHRLVRFERGIRFLGALDFITNPRLLKHLKDDKIIEDFATYRAFQWRWPNARVSRNFLDVLGVRPALGRGFLETDREDAAVITDDLWRSRFHGDPGIAGRTVQLANRPYRIVGVLPPNFWFTNERFWFYAPLPKDLRFFSAVALLKQGQTPSSAQAQVRRIAQIKEFRWIAESVAVLPLWDDPRKQDLTYVGILGIAGAVLGFLFLSIRGLGGVRYRLLLMARLFLLLIGLSAAQVAVLRLSPGPQGPYSIIHLWFFLLVCIAASCLVVRDHGARCLVCFRRLRLPAPIGVWGSPILDQPGTEYVCPDGHGTLYIAETGNAEDYWTVLDESWHDLFVHTHR